jgi:hypothetical protein
MTTQAGSKEQWSPELVALTHELLLPIPAITAGRIHMKNLDGRKGYFPDMELFEGILRLRILGATDVESYEDIHAVIDSGWVVD